MTRLHRAIIFYSFMVLFLMVAPLLLLYTAGYRYNVTNGKIARVGVLMLKSEPKNADIAIDGHAIKEKTPALIELAADEYDVLITKPGYHPWSKIVAVKSKQTTFAEDIVLWKDELPRRLFALDARATQLSPSGIYAMALDPLLGLVLYNFQTETLTPVTNLDATELLDITFSPDEAHALISYKTKNNHTEFLVITTARGELVDTKFLNQFGFTHLSWAKTAGTLYGVRRNVVFSANVFTKRIDSLAQGNDPFLLQGTTVWSITPGEQVFLSKSAAGSSTAPEPIVELPQGTYEILPAPEPYLLLHERAKKIIRLLDLRNPTEIIFELPATHATYNLNNQNELEILAWNDFELWRANAGTNEQELIRRQRAPILLAAWYNNGTHIIIASNGTIEVVERHTDDERITTTIAFLEHALIRNFAISPRGDTLLFIATDGTENGLYSLELQ